MADKNQLKIADQVDLADDDPFAELTRIMGFDPRQPARQAQPAPQEPAAEDDDFSLDLEKELLGGIDFEDEQASAPDAFAAEDLAAEAAYSEPETAGVDFDFSADFDAAMSAPEAFEAPAAADSELRFDGDLDAAFAAAGEAAHDDAFEFDLALSDEDVGSLDETPAARAPLPVTPETVALPRDVEADLDAAMADIDMDFLHDAPELEAAAEPAFEAAGAPLDAGHGELPDIALFDASDFEFEEEAAIEGAPALQAAPEAGPDADEPALHFGDDDFRLDDVSPSAEQATQPAVEDFSFDDVDFGGDFTPEPVNVDAPAEPVAVAAATERSVPPAAAPFELSVPAYVPRKLPVSPMDIAAEEFRQREVAAAPAEAAFNLEDELNALLGNIRSNAAGDPASVAGAAESETPSHAPPAFEPQGYASPASAIFGSAGGGSYAQPGGHAPEPAGFDAPEHPVDIDDNLNWELDEAFSAEAGPARVEEDQDDFAPAYDHSRDERFDAHHEQPAAGYVRGIDEGQVPVDLDDIFGELSPERLSPQPEVPYREALAGIAAGAAAARFGGAGLRSPASPPAGLSGLGSRVPERFAHRQDDAPRAEGFSPHRDPVVRGNPLKEDPLDIITQLAEKYSKKEPVTAYGRDMGVAAGALSTVRQGGYAADDDIDISDAFEEQPDVETIEVNDRAIALADDLDIPELPEDEDPPPASDYDDLDAEFSSLLSDMNAAEAQSGGRADPLAGGFSARPYESRVAAAPQGAYRQPAQAYQQPAQAYEGDYEQDFFALEADDGVASRPASDDRYPTADYQYDPDVDQDIAPASIAASRRRPVSRGILLAGAVGAVAIVGAIGAFAFSFGDSEDAPAIVRADESPIKVRPENPGGAAVPNQDNKVYQTVAGEGGVDAPQQEKLVTTTEEPMEVSPPALEDGQAASASGKSEDRIEQILEEASNQSDDEIVAVAPRKVRTMVVKPDGTLVPREETPAATSGEQTEAIAAATPDAAPAPAIPEAAAGLPSDQAAALPAAPQEPEAAATEPSEGEPEATAATPETVPIAPLRPADQPIDVVGEVKPDQVAAATTAAAAGGGWAMQIASQPSEAAAQSSYQDLARRYGAVLAGREVNIVKAEIAGKGTFWRVRVPAASRNEAIGLCENYKAAGGNCFVSR